MFAMAPSTSRHMWRTTSAHRTSSGTVRYQSCPCGFWRIAQDHAYGAPAILSEIDSEPASLPAYDGTEAKG